MNIYFIFSSMPQTNKGYQMLKKMGWKEGQMLGTTDSGLVEPVSKFISFVIFFIYKFY